MGESKDVPMHLFSFLLRKLREWTNWTYDEEA